MTHASRCAEAGDLGCGSGTHALCVPDCPGDECISAGVEASDDGAETTAVGSRLSFETVSVPACPDVARMVGLPTVSVVGATNYEGTVTVQALEAGASDRATLVYNERVDQSVTLSLVGTTLEVGQRFEAVIRGGGTGSATYGFVALRDDAGVLRLAAASGRDTLYQQGMFSTPEAMGLTVTLRMACQSAVDDGCFRDQVQADYEADVSTEDGSFMTDGGSREPVNIEGRPYSFYFLSSSVDGGEPLCDESISTGRYLDLAVVAQ